MQRVLIQRAISRGIQGADLIDHVFNELLTEASKAGRERWILRNEGTVRSQIKRSAKMIPRETFLKFAHPKYIYAGT